MILISSWSRLCPIIWSQVLNREWRCSWSSADRRCSNYIWVIDNLITYWGAPYIRDLTVFREKWSENKNYNETTIVFPPIDHTCMIIYCLILCNHNWHGYVWIYTYNIYTIYIHIYIYIYLYNCVYVCMHVSAHNCAYVDWFTYAHCMPSVCFSFLFEWVQFLGRTIAHVDYLFIWTYHYHWPGLMPRIMIGTIYRWINRGIQREASPCIWAHSTIHIYANRFISMSFSFWYQES